MGRMGRGRQTRSSCTTGGGGQAGAMGKRLPGWNHRVVTGRGALGRGGADGIGRQKAEENGNPVGGRCPAEHREQLFGQIAGQWPVSENLGLDLGLRGNVPPVLEVRTRTSPESKPAPTSYLNSYFKKIMPLHDLTVTESVFSYPSAKHFSFSSENCSK